MKSKSDLMKLRDELCDDFMKNRNHPLNKPDPVEGFYMGWRAAIEAVANMEFTEPEERELIYQFWNSSFTASLDRHSFVEGFRYYHEELKRRLLK